MTYKPVILFYGKRIYLSKLFAAIENSSYAHAGIILKRSGKIYIVHDDIAEGEDGLRIQEWKDFLKNAKRWKVLRLKNPPQNNHFEAILNKYIKLKPSFNLDFAEEKNGSLYCTEFIQVVYKEAASITLAKTRSSLSPFKKNYLNRLSSRLFHILRMQQQFARRSYREFL